MVRKAALMLMVAAVPAHAASGPWEKYATFNLVCTGTDSTWTRQGLGMKDKTEKPFAITYRVDLGSKRFCSGDCTLTKALVEVAETTITFEKDETPAILADTVAMVQRETGRYIYRARFGDFINLREATCERAPFSGFPTRKF
jgi:hypothetical protein